MEAILGAEGINDEKFTPWATRQRVLGLEFDSTAELVRVPQTKIAKARRIIVAADAVTVLSRKAYRSLLGSLRHVATCIRAARPFLQRLRIRERHLHRFQSVTVSDGVSLEYFNALPPPDIIIEVDAFRPLCSEYEVDASDFGLCALDITAEHALTYRYTPTEIDLITDFKAGAPNNFDINYRELLSCAFAVHAWGPRWVSDSHDNRRPRHVHFRVDNMSAVAWHNKLSSRNPRAQVLIRLLSWKQRIVFGFLHFMWLEWTTFALTPAPAYRLTSLMRLCFHH
ncbi:LOW QUALITY PROTEIN: hypothetical protein PHMEG_0007007 [Phytophthora megakarya]|uniref:Uncharacterized protein n=1 Tax=Phytophthora megakarya TaxID=4795 RepID=A0A225WMG8_9STRA|nr:LOW QUALITY PROTEIN: hypothetical protein PHMEG_0007007 [Phytophthora megakarya]